MEKSSSSSSEKQEKPNLDPEPTEEIPQLQDDPEINNEQAQLLPQKTQEPAPDPSGQVQNLMAIMQNSKASFNCAGLCCNLIFLLPIIIILAVYDQDCDNPIRLWLIVQAAYMGAYLVVTIVVQVCMMTGQFLQLAPLFACVNVVLGLFGFAWMIVGSVWLFGDDECSDDFEAGYVLTLIYLIFAYTAIGCLSLCSCCFMCCAGVIAAVK